MVTLTPPFGVVGVFWKEEIMRGCSFTYAGQNSEDYNLALFFVGSAPNEVISGGEYELSTDIIPHISEQLLYRKKYENPLEFEIEIINPDDVIPLEQMRIIKKWLFSQSGWKTFKLQDPDYNDYYLKCLLVPKEDIIDGLGYRGVRCTLHNNSPFWYKEPTVVRKYFSDMWNGGADNEYPIYRDFYMNVLSDSEDIVLPTIRIYSPQWQGKLKLLAIRNEEGRDTSTLCSLNVDIDRTVLDNNNLGVQNTTVQTYASSSDSDSSPIIRFTSDYDGIESGGYLYKGLGVNKDKDIDKSDYYDLTFVVDNLADGESIASTDFTIYTRTMNVSTGNYEPNAISDSDSLLSITKTDNNTVRVVPTNYKKNTNLGRYIQVKVTTSSGNELTSYFAIWVRQLSELIALNATQIVLRIGDTFDLNSFNIDPTYSFAYVRDYYSGDTNIATVEKSGGLVTAISIGKCNVKCILRNGHYAECAVTVIDPDGVLNIDCANLRAWFTDKEGNQLDVPLSPNGESPLYFTKDEQLFGIGMSEEFYNIVTNNGGYVEVEYTPLVAIGGF